MDQETDAEAALSLELARKIAPILAGQNGHVVGATIGQLFAGWLMNHPESARRGLAMAFLKYALQVIETMTKIDAEKRH